MAKIVYGVSGEGSGHAARSYEVLSHLAAAGHDIVVVTYDRGIPILRDEFRVIETEGLEIATRDNKVSMVKTFTENVKKLAQGHRKFAQLRDELFKPFAPDVVISDFEPMTAHLANHYDIPLITLDNQHSLRYMKYPCPDYLSKERRLTETIIRAMIPKPDVSLVSTFYLGKPTNQRTFLYPPILRSSFYEIEPHVEPYILVYLTRGFESFLETLRHHFKRESFIVYGCESTGQYGSLFYKPFSKTEFPKDLANCKAVMATAGFGLITEAIFLHKPYLALPLAGQFEQEINGYLLNRLSYGKVMRDPDPDKIASFLYHLPEYRSHLEAYKKANNNNALLQKLDELLIDDCKLVREFMRERRATETPI